MTNRESDIANAVTAINASYAGTAGTDPATPGLMQGFPPSADNQVTRANWMLPPYNRWGYHNVRRLTATTAVLRSTQAAPLNNAPADLDDWRFDSLSGRPVGIEEHLRASYTDGFLVMRGDDILYEQYFNGQQATDQHIMFSVTKSLIGVITEDAIRRFNLDEQTTAVSVIPELEGSAYADATLRDLLDMAVGIDYDEEYQDPDSGSSLFFYAGGFISTPERYRERAASLYDLMPTFCKRGDHGGLFHYVTICTEVLAWMTERMTGISMTDALTRLWQAAGCENDGYFVTDSKGRAACGAGFNGTLRDMGRLTRLFAAKGKNQSGEYLMPGVIEHIAAGTDPTAYARNEEFDLWTPGASYRSQWYVFNGESMLGCGIHGQYIFIDFASCIVMVKQSSLPVAENDIDTDTVRMMRQLASFLA